MIQLKVNIPTSLSEIKEFWNTHKSNRTRNNRNVVLQLQKDIYDVLNNGYWSKDISEYFIKNMKCSGKSYLSDCFKKAMSNLK